MHRLPCPRPSALSPNEYFITPSSAIRITLSVGTCRHSGRDENPLPQSRPTPHSRPLERLPSLRSYRSVLRLRSVGLRCAAAVRDLAELKAGPSDWTEALAGRVPQRRTRLWRQWNVPSSERERKGWWDLRFLRVTLLFLGLPLGWRDDTLPPPIESWDWLQLSPVTLNRRERVKKMDGGMDGGMTLSRSSLPGPRLPLCVPGFPSL